MKKWPIEFREMCHTMDERVAHARRVQWMLRQTGEGADEVVAVTLDVAPPEPSLVERALDVLERIGRLRDCPVCAVDEVDVGWHLTDCALVAVLRAGGRR